MPSFIDKLNNTAAKKECLNPKAKHRNKTVQRWVEDKINNNRNKKKTIDDETHRIHKNKCD